VFFNENIGGCDIYPDRPLECRLLKCWDPTAIASVYVADRLVRADLLGPAPALRELVAAHQSRCDYGAVLSAMKKRTTPLDFEARKVIGEAVRYDREIRRLVAERAGVSPDLHDFLFGRPLSDILGGLGLEVRETGERTTFALKANRDMHGDG